MENFSLQINGKSSKSITMKLPISAMIVAKNEADLLKDCLEMLYFCEEIIVIDLKSEDNTVEIAKENGATKIINDENIPFAEFALKKHINKTKHKWVLITDPDEVAKKDLIDELYTLFNTNLKQDTCKIGVVNAPIFFYFKRKKLRGTTWGGLKYRHYLIHKDRFYFEEKVHAGRILKEGFDNYYIKFNKSNFIKHFWIDNYTQFIEKHKRYIEYEGKTRFENGNRTSISEIIKEPFYQFFFSFFRRRGFKDGFNGLLLSILRSWYFTNSLVRLYVYQRKN